MPETPDRSHPIFPARTQSIEDAHAAGASLFAETLAAHGGDSLLAFKTLKITGTGWFTTPPQIGGLTVPLSACTLSLASGGRSRLEARSPGGRLVMVTRGDDRGGFVVIAGRTITLSAEQTNSIEPLGLLRAAATNGYPVVAASDAPTETTDDGKTLLRFVILRPTGNPTQISVDSETKLVRKTVTTTSRGTMTVLLSGYAEIGGLPVFGELLLQENGENIIKLVRQEAVWDEWMKDAIFEQP